MVSISRAIIKSTRFWLPNSSQPNKSLIEYIAQLNSTKYSMDQLKKTNYQNIDSKHNNNLKWCDWTTTLHGRGYYLGLVYLASYTLCHKNFEVKCIWRVVLGWVLFLKILCTLIPHGSVWSTPWESLYIPTHMQMYNSLWTSGCGLFPMIWFVGVANCLRIQEYICDLKKYKKGDID
jgi:hypothetical protein